MNFQVAMLTFEPPTRCSNHDQRVEGTGNRATRLDVSTMYDMYKWAGVGAVYDKSLRSINYKANPSGLFVKVDSTNHTTQARVGKAGNATKFDIIPSHTAPTDAGRAPRYSFVNKPNTGEKTWQWLKFKTDPAARPRQVTANVGAPTEESMVRVHIPTAKKPEFDKNIFQFEAAALSEKPPSPDDPRYLLRVEGRGIPTEIVEGDDIEPESADVQLVDVASGDQNALNVSTKKFFPQRSHALLTFLVLVGSLQSSSWSRLKDGGVLSYDSEG